MFVLSFVVNKDVHKGSYHPENIKQLRNKWRTLPEMQPLMWCFYIYALIT